MAKETSLPAEGQGEVAPAQGQETAPGNGQGEAWWKAPDGTAFESPEHLGKVWKDSVMMRGDYTKKTQAVAEERKRLEEERRRFDLDRQEHARIAAEREERAKKYEAMDKLLKERPDIYRDLEKRLKSAPGADVIAERIEKQFEEKYGSKLSELEQWKVQQEADRLRNEAYVALKSKYTDFDGEAVDKELDELAAKLKSGDIGYLAELLYHSKKKATPPTPEAIEEAKRGAQLLPGSGSAAPPPQRKSFKNFEEARRRAHAG